MEATKRVVEDDRDKRDPVPNDVNLSAVLNNYFLFGCENIL